MSGQVLRFHDESCPTAGMVAAPSFACIAAHGRPCASTSDVMLRDMDTESAALFLRRNHRNACDV